MIHSPLLIRTETDSSAQTPTVAACSTDRSPISCLSPYVVAIGVAPAAAWTINVETRFRGNGQMFQYLSGIHSSGRDRKQPYYPH